MPEPLPPGPVDPVALGGADILEALERARHRHGDLVRLARPGGDVWLVAGPGLARAVLGERPQDFGKGPASRRSRGLPGVLGGGLLTNADEARRLQRRRLLQPAFTQQRIDALTPAVAAATAARVARWLPPERATATATSSVDVYPEMEELAAGTLQRLLFGRLLEHAGARRLRLPLATGVARAGEARAARARVDRVVREEIERRARRPMPPGVGDALGLLLAGRARGEIDDDGVLDEMATLVLAGVETTASAAAFAMALLAHSPAVQRDVVEEVDTVLQGRPPTAADLRRLPRVDAVIDEGLRLFPAIPAAPRRALRETLLGGYLVPAGTRLLVSIHVLHRHPHHWRSPARFRPERFLSGEAGTRSAFLPFGAGSHLCIGRDLARLQARLVVALAVQRARLAASEGERLGRRVAVGLTPAGGTSLVVRPRPKAGPRTAV